jgi:hypothetical protein
MISLIATTGGLKNLSLMHFFGTLSYQQNAHDAYVFDVSKQPYCIRLLATTLQGIVNRQTDSGQIYLIFSNDDWSWLNYYNSRFGFSFESIDNVYDLLNVYKNCITGYVVYDSEVPYSTDIATTIAGLNGSIVIPSYMVEEVEKCGIPMDYDLRGRFEGLSKIQIYEWGYKNLWPKCSREVIGNTYRPPNWVSLNLTEYLRGSDTVYLKFEDAYPEDGYGSELYYAELHIGEKDNITYIVPATSSEANVVCDSNGSWIDRDGYRIADGSEHWTYEFDLGRNTRAQLTLEIYQQYLVSIATNPAGPWTVAARCTDQAHATGTRPHIIDYLVCKKAFVMGLSSKIDSERALKGKFLSEMNPLGLVLGWASFQDGEWPYVRQASENGLLVLCCLESPNYSFHSKVKPSINFEQTELSGEVQVENKVYLTFIHSDGDALWQLSNRFFGSWEDPARGSFPFGWEIQPLLYDLAPGILQYYYETRSDKDEFVGSLSGMGYIQPDNFPPELLQSYLEKTNLYLEKSGLRTLYVSPWNYASDTLIGQYTRYVNTSIGFFEGYETRVGGPFYSGGSVWFRTNYLIQNQTTEQVKADLEAMAAATTNRPLFITIHVSPNQWINMDKVIGVLDPAKFEVVTPSKFAVLASNAHAR